MASPSDRPGSHSGHTRRLPRLRLDPSNHTPPRQEKGRVIRSHVGLPAEHVLCLHHRGSIPSSPYPLLGTSIPGPAPPLSPPVSWPQRRQLDHWLRKYPCGHAIDLRVLRQGGITLRIRKELEAHRGRTTRQAWYPTPEHLRAALSDPRRRRNVGSP